MVTYVMPVWLRTWSLPNSRNQNCCKKNLNGHPAAWSSKSS